MRKLESDCQIVGDMVASSRLRVPHNVVATTDCEVLVIDGHAVGALGANHPGVVTAWRELVAIRSSRLSSPQGLPDTVRVPDAAAGVAEETKDL